MGGLPVTGIVADRVQLYPPRFDDLPPALLTAGRIGGAGVPSLAAITGNVNALTFADGDYVYSSTEFTHNFQEGTPITIHVHWATNGLEETAKYVKFEVEYCTASGNGGAFSSATAPSQELTIPANTPDRTYYISTIGTITGLVVGSYIAFRFKRITATGDAPVANPFVIAVGFHCAMDTLGSSTLVNK